MLVWLALAAALSPSPAPLQPPRCAAVDAISFEDAFAYHINDVAKLRLIAAFATVPAPRQEALFDAGVAANASPGCLTADAGHEAARALTLIDNIWKVVGLDDAAKSAAFSRTVAAAFVAPSPPAPFAALLPATTEQATCAGPNEAAAIVKLVRPQYTVAIAARVTGSVVTEVSLDENGLVRNASVFRSDIGSTPEAQAVLREALLGAAATTYRPACADGYGVAGRYLFGAQFAVKR